MRQTNAPFIQTTGVIENLVVVLSAWWNGLGWRLDRFNMPKISSPVQNKCTCRYNFQDLGHPYIVSSNILDFTSHPLSVNILGEGILRWEGKEDLNHSPTKTMTLYMDVIIAGILCGPRIFNLFVPRALD